MISVQKIKKEYGSQLIFENVTFNLNPKERVGLVGRNGHGKTTLFRVVNGEESPTAGEVSIPRDYILGTLSQHIEFKEDTVLKEACRGLREDELEDTWRVEKVLTGLGYLPTDFDRSPSEFSGGYQVRLNLAKILVSKPDLLLLDEPTNFLDIISIRWLEKFLKAWQGELIVISHDRDFMDNVTTHIMGVHRQNVKKIKGNTSNYYNQIEMEEEIYEKGRANLEKKQKQMEQFITRFRSKATKATLVQSRVKALERMGTMSKLSNIDTLGFRFPYKDTHTKFLKEAKNISFGYQEDNPLIKDFNIVIERKDKICIIGKNGKGKTTLLRLLTGALATQTGSVDDHPTLVENYYEQANTAKLNPQNSIEDEMGAVAIGRGPARNICGLMMFSGDSALKKIQVLSGGEKCRVLIGKLLVSPSNLLMLDEPTHHMDMQSCDAMIEAVANFEGSAIIVTHDEHFLYRVATKLIVFQGDQPFIFNGTYSEFLEKVGWESETEDGIIAAKKLEDKANRGTSFGINKKELRKLRADFNSKRSKNLNPLKKKVSTIEVDIEKAELDIEKDNELILEVSGNGDNEKLIELSKKVAKKQNVVQDLYDKLDRTSALYDEANKKYINEEIEVFGKSKK